MISINYKNASIELEDDSSILDLIKKTKAENCGFTSATVNSAQVDFTTKLQNKDNVSLETFDSPLGKNVFWHTSAHILAQAILRLYPNAIPTIGPVIENGFFYDFANLSLSEQDFDKIEEEVKNIIKENISISKIAITSKQDALEKFGNNKYKAELINSFEDNSIITGYQQADFFDLCRGPHLTSTGQVKAFKVLKTSAAYWKGDPSNDSLTRVYGISFPSDKELRVYLTYLEEAKKRDHKVLGPKLDLFSHSEFAPGMTFMHPRGMNICNALIDFWKLIHFQAGYQEIKTPVLMSKELWEISGHWENYKQNMYTLVLDEREYAVKPMNCPGCMLYYKTKHYSYRDLPLKIAEIGLVHRHEASGALSGLTRVRSFHQDDAHIFVSPAQLEAETMHVLSLLDTLYSTFGLEYRLELSTKPEKNTIGSDELWDQATEALKNALTNNNKDFKISPGEGAFYGPKIDIHVKDALNRTWQCGTIQLDMFLPDRFKLEYTEHDGTRQTPIMLHRALFGSIERFMGILIEHFNGKFPLWMSPEQVRLITVADRHEQFGSELHAQLIQAGIIASLDASSESVSKKIRNAQISQVNYMATIGDKESENKTVTIRTRDNRIVGEMSIDVFLKTILEEKKTFSLKPLL